MANELIDVELEARIVKGKAQAFWQGDYQNNEEGEEPKEEWVWLPLSQIEVEESGSGKCVMVTMPEWLAQNKGLI